MKLILVLMGMGWVLAGCQNDSNPVGPNTSVTTTVVNTPTPGILTPTAIPTTTAIPTSTPGIGTPTFVPTSTPAVAPTPVVVGAIGNSFNPMFISIPVGTTVIWDASLAGHTVHLHTLAGTCGQDILSFPNATIFNTVGTIGVHCDVHSSCGAGNCTGCTGMVMTINVF